MDRIVYRNALFWIRIIRKKTNKMVSKDAIKEAYKINVPYSMLLNTISEK
jgi:hypothetical protein